MNGLHIPLPWSLVLPGPLEARYWSDKQIVQQTVMLDRLGLALGAAINLFYGFATISKVWPVDVVCMITGAAQLLHIVWTWYDSRSHCKWRLVIALIHRLRWVAIIMYVTAHGTMEQLLSPYSGKHLHHASWRAFCTIVVTTSMQAVIASTNLPLPARYQAIYALVIVAMYASVLAHHQLAAMELLRVIPHLNATCLAFRKVLTPSFLEVYPPGVVPMYCSPGNELLFLTFLYMLLAGLLPLALTYWHEYCSKRAFLRRLKPTQDHKRFLKPFLDFGSAVGPLGRAVGCWAALSICWSTLAILRVWIASMWPVIRGLVASCS